MALPCSADADLEPRLFHQSLGLSPGRGGNGLSGGGPGSPGNSRGFGGFGSGFGSGLGFGLGGAESGIVPSIQGSGCGKVLPGVLDRGKKWLLSDEGYSGILKAVPLYFIEAMFVGIIVRWKAR